MEDRQALYADLMDDTKVYVEAALFAVARIWAARTHLAGRRKSFARFPRYPSATIAHKRALTLFLGLATWTSGQVGLVEEGKLTKLVPDTETHPWLEKVIGWYRQGGRWARFLDSSMRRG